MQTRATITGSYQMAERPPPLHSNTVSSLYPTHCRNMLAERVGFEPTNTVRCYTLSRRAPSTARPPLHKPSICSILTARVGLTRAILALALPARCARPKSLQAILSNPRTRLGVTHFPGVRLRPLGHLSSRPQGYRSGPSRSNLPAGGRLVRGGRLVARR